MNYLKNYGEWLKTTNGRKMCGALAATAAGSTFAGIFVPNTLYLSKYEEIVSYYKNGVVVPVSKTMQATFEKAISLAGIPEPYKQFYRPFNVCGFDVFSAGTSSSKFGCAIGLPTNFAFTDVDLIDKQSIKIAGESVVWDTQEAKSLLESLVLSEKAKTYIIAREAKMLNKPKLLLDSTLASLMVLVTYRFCHLINQRYNFVNQPRVFRFAMYSLVATLCSCNYYFIKDMIQLYYEKEVDSEMKKDPVLVEGAIEFYGKMLQRNRALRFLLGKEGESLFTLQGNENYLIRQCHLPLVQRKSFFEEAKHGKAPAEKLIPQIQTVA